MGQKTVQSEHLDQSPTPCTSLDQQVFDLRNAAFEIAFGSESAAPTLDTIKIRSPSSEKPEILISSLPSRTTGGLVSSFFEKTCDTPGPLTHSELHQFLEDAKNSGAEIASTLGDSLDKISFNFSRVVRGEEHKELGPKCRVRWLDIPRFSESAKVAPLRWLDIEKPNEAVLRTVAQRFDIKFADLIRCIKEGHPPNSYRYSRYLVNRLDEIQIEEERESVTVNQKTVCAFLGDDYFITISGGRSQAISRVFNEVRSQEAPPEEISSSNHLCSRLLGATLHINEATTERLDAHSREFIQQHSKGLPGERELQQVSSLSQSLAKALHAIQGTDTIMCALQEKRNLFGSGAPRDALGRYQGMLSSIVRSMELTKQALENLRDTWQDQGDRWRNDILFKIALLTGAVSLPSMAAGFFGMNFAQNPIPDHYIWGGIAAATGLSAGLVIRLLQSRRSFQG
ncbi:MAG: hypothetical protein J5J00_16315 [Deltaproteobacteria bacterium]|nr:hypothetical protein [Deltaproteobacteria bacterium]